MLANYIVEQKYPTLDFDHIELLSEIGPHGDRVPKLSRIMSQKLLVAWVTNLIRKGDQ